VPRLKAPYKSVALPKLDGLLMTLDSNLNEPSRLFLIRASNLDPV
jgi:hypothetical protein